MNNATGDIPLICLKQSFIPRSQLPMHIADWQIGSQKTVITQKQLLYDVIHISYRPSKLCAQETAW